jgi:ATP-dependent helicase/nuclease subunit A
MLFVGDRAQPRTGETEAYAATTAASLRAIADSPERRARAMFEVEDAPALPMTRLAAERSPAPIEDAWVAVERPPWRSLPIAATALQDFRHCPRRFELAHVLDLPEPGGAFVERIERDTLAGPSAATRADALAEGTLAHRVLEQVDAASFGAGLLARAEASRVLERAGVAAGHPKHPLVVDRVLRFLGGTYAARIAALKAHVGREVPFVLDLRDAEGRVVTLRGTIDLLVRWRDGSVDVVDYKRARDASVDSHALQLDAYALAARAIAPEATRVRAGIVFLGGGAGEPVWRASVETGPEVALGLASLAARLVEARWGEAFPRVPLATCKAIRCGYVPYCYPAHLASTPSSSSER